MSDMSEHDRAEMDAYQRGFREGRESGLNTVDERRIREREINAAFASLLALMDEDTRLLGAFSLVQQAQEEMARILATSEPKP